MHQLNAIHPSMVHYIWIYLFYIALPLTMSIRNSGHIHVHRPIFKNFPDYWSHLLFRSCIFFFLIPTFTDFNEVQTGVPLLFSFSWFPGLKICNSWIDLVKYIYWYIYYTPICPICNHITLVSFPKALQHQHCYNTIILINNFFAIHLNSVTKNLGNGGYPWSTCKTAHTIQRDYNMERA